MLNPLITKKTAGTTGVIVESSITHPGLRGPPPKQQAKESNILQCAGSSDMQATFDQFGEIADAFERETATGPRFYVQYLAREDATRAYAELTAQGMDV